MSIAADIFGMEWNEKTQHGGDNYEKHICLSYLLTHNSTEQKQKAWTYSVHTYRFWMFFLFVFFLWTCCCHADCFSCWFICFVYCHIHLFELTILDHTWMAWLILRCDLYIKIHWVSSHIRYFHTDRQNVNHKIEGEAPLSLSTELGEFLCDSDEEFNGFSDLECDWECDKHVMLFML